MNNNLPVKYNQSNFLSEKSEKYEEDTIGLRTEFSFEAKLIAGWIIGEYRTEFLEVIEKIHEEINYNRNWFNVFGLTENIPKEDFFNVFNTYYWVVFDKNNKLAEYDGNKGDTDSNNVGIVKMVSLATGLHTKKVNAMLKQLYWSTIQNRIPSTKWIKPVTFMKYEGYRKLRDDAAGSQWGRTLLWILGFIALGTVGFYGFKAYAAYKSTKLLTTGKI